MLERLTKADSRGGKPSMQLSRGFEVSTGRHANPTTPIAPISELINAEPKRPPHLSEDRRRHRRM